MYKNVYKINLIKIFLFFNILKSFQFQNSDLTAKESKIYLQAKKEGFDLSDPNDDFFHDICIQHSYDNKDTTLELKRKYFFFPNNNNKEYTFNNPKRNNTNLCFFELLSFSGLFKNMTFLFLFPIFFFQLILFSITFVIFINKSFTNTPFSKRQMLEKNKIFCFLCRKYNNNKKKITQNYSEFTPEVNINSQDKSSGCNETVNNLMLNEIQKNEDENVNEKEMEIEQKKENDNSINQKKKSTDSQKPFIKTNNYERTSTNEEIKDRNIEGSQATANFDEEKKDNNNEINNIINDKDKVGDINEGKDDKNDKENNEVFNVSPREKSVDNYTFGMDVQIGYDFNKKTDKDGKKSSNTNRKKDKMTRLIFNSINENNKKIKKHNYIPPMKTQSIIKETADKIEYIREEYFYFGYLLARIEDKRTVFQIYVDLLEQCQIIFKLLLIPFNIYEDRNLQLIYYGIKIELYFLFNVKLINNNVLNNIYFNNNNIIDDLYRSLLASIFTCCIGLFIYYLTHIKKTLIKRRYQVINMRIIDQRINLDIIKLTNRICLNYLYSKLIILLVAFITMYLYIFYSCYSFCSLYQNTQIYVFKGVCLSIIISQSVPFFLCLIPAFLRKKSISKKNQKLYSLVKLIEQLFIA